jgi:hypothetical protein
MISPPIVTLEGEPEGEGSGDAGRPLADKILEVARLAIATGAGPVLVAAAAVAATEATSVREVAALLSERALELDRLLAEGPGEQGRRPAPLEPALRFEPELGRARPEIGDHEIRGKLLFGEMLGKMSFFQVVAWAIGGVTLSAEDAELLAQSGIVTQLLEVEIWPLAVTRRIAARGAGLGAALLGGVAALCTPRLAAMPVAGFMRFLDRVEQDLAGGSSLDEVIGAVLKARERVPGMGRPVLGPDERVPQQLSLYARYGRAEGPSVQLARGIDRSFFAAKGLRINSAGMHGALLRDLGFSPPAAAALSTLYFIVPVLAHAVFAEERAASATNPRPARRGG